MNKTIETKIGQNIRTIRENAGMTQDALAAQLQLHGCDITRSAVAKIEVGQRPLPGRDHSASQNSEHYLRSHIGYLTPP